MLPQALTLEEISHVIALATAPAFLLAGVVAFLTLLANRMAQITQRARDLDNIDDRDQRRFPQKADVSKLRRQAWWIRRGMALSILCGLLTSLLVVIAFVGALLNLNVESAIAVLFVLALVSFMAALCCLVFEVILSLHEFRHYV